MTFAGMVSAIVTPFTADAENVDEGTLVALIEQGIADGLSGFVPCGGTGEFATLSDGERRRVVEITCSQVNGRANVIAQVGSTSTRAAVGFARHAEANGANALMVATPYYEPLTMEGAFRYLADVASSVSIPICVYNFPPAMGVVWERDSLTRIKQEVPSVEIVKDSSGDFASLTSLTQKPIPGVEVMVGEDVLIAPALLAGVDGAIVGSTNFLAPGLVKLQSAAKAGDVFEVHRLWHAMMPVINEVVGSGMYNGSVKAACQILGFPVGPIREPYSTLSADATSRLATVIDATDPSLLSWRK